MTLKVHARLDQRETNGVKVKRVVHKRCCVSPILLNVNRETFEDIGDFTERKINTIKCTDELVVLQKTEEGLQSMLHRIIEVRRKHDTKININKAKEMTGYKRLEEAEHLAA